MKKIKSLYLLLACVLLLQACDDQRAKNYNNTTLVDDNGLDFIRTATEAGLTEIKASELAEKTSHNQRVINFAKMMVVDHSQVEKELTVLADKKYVTQSDSLKNNHKYAIDSLSKLSGGDFDKKYIQMMVTDHTQAVELFQNASKNKSSAIQKFAIKILPTLKMHLDSAKAIFAGLK